VPNRRKGEPLLARLSKKSDDNCRANGDGGVLLQASSKRDWSGDGQQMMRVKYRASGAAHRGSLVST
jgi:hypothetical protein